MDETPTPTTAPGNAGHAPAWPEPLHLQRPWTIADVCAWIGCSENTLAALIRDASFPTGTKLGGKRLVRWRPADVLAWLEGQFDAAAGTSTVAATSTQGGRVLSSGSGQRLGVATRKRQKANK